MSATTALRFSPAELAASLERAQDRVNVLRCVKELRAERTRLNERLAEIDHALSVLSEPLHDAMLSGLRPAHLRPPGTDSVGPCPECGALIYLGHPHICCSRKSVA